jgi:hypothetical protein
VILSETRVEPERTRVRSAVIWLTLGLWAFAATTFAGSILLGGSRGLTAPVMAWLGLCTLTGLGLSLVLRQLLQQVKIRSARARWTLLIGAAVALASIQALVDGAIHALIDHLSGPGTEAWFDPKHFGMNALIYVGLFGFYAATLELISMTGRAAEHARVSATYAAQAAEARALAREAQVRLLQLQMNPHFLFNTLNCVSSLIAAGRAEAADRMIARLSDFLRVSLETSVEGVSPLGNELAALEAYLEIEATRFPDTLDLEIDCPDRLHEVPTPNLILQPLLEAAVHHAHSAEGGARRMRLIIRRDNDSLIVRAIDASLIPSGAPPFEGHGLQTVRRRLEVIYGAAASMHVSPPDDGFRIELSFPLHPTPTASD